jgi:hypothetical protein
MRSLEWACAKARVTGIRDEESESDSIPTFHLDRPSFGQEADDLYDTETEIDEAITPDTSADISPVISAVEYKDCQSRVGKGLSRQQGENGSDVYTSGDVEAAMVLLGFMSRA